MATKRPYRNKPQPQAPKPKPKTTLQNLAARPPSFDEEDEQLVDNSGVFRVTTSIARDQIGHGDDSVPRFPSDSLVMQAQRDGVKDDGPTIDEAVEEHQIEDETQRAEKRQRLQTLAARARSRVRR